MLPETLHAALAPVTVVVGHYGVGKTNFCMNLALDLAEEGKQVTLIDLDIVNPYFRASEQRDVLEERGVTLVAPVFAERGTSLDVPSLTGRIMPAIADATPDAPVIIDVGGDDAGATALGRFRSVITGGAYAVLAVVNRFRNLVSEPQDALANLREIEGACGLKATGLVNNAHLKGETIAATVGEGMDYARELAELAHLPLVCTTVPVNLGTMAVENEYPVRIYVKNPWE